MRTFRHTVNCSLRPLRWQDRNHFNHFEIENSKQQSQLTFPPLSFLNHVSTTVSISPPSSSSPSTTRTRLDLGRVLHPLPILGPLHQHRQPIRTDLVPRLRRKALLQKHAAPRAMVSNPRVRRDAVVRKVDHKPRRMLAHPLEEAFLLLALIKN